MSAGGRVCLSCRRLGGQFKRYDGVEVVLCADCDHDPFRRERVIAEVRGVPYDVNTTPWPVRR